MKRCRPGLLAIGLAVLLSSCGTTKTFTRTVTVDEATKGGPEAPLVRDEFGYVKSLARKGNAFELRFDPAWFLSGKTANVAAAEDGVVEPGEPVPNDNYTVDEGHRLLTYIVPRNAGVTVLAEGVTGTPITVAQLADLVAGKNPLGKPLFEPLTTGFWIRVRIDTVRSLDQQYRP